MVRQVLGVRRAAGRIFSLLMPSEDPICHSPSPFSPLSHSHRAHDAVLRMERKRNEPVQQHDARWGSWVLPHLRSFPWEKSWAEEELSWP